MKSYIVLVGVVVALLAESAFLWARPAVPSPCKYSYTQWGACRSDGRQIRSIVSKKPLTCSGKPVLSQSCRYTPPCTYTYSRWSACRSNGTQIRTVQSKTPFVCEGNPAVFQNCTYTPPACSFTYSPWSDCRADGTQTRTVASSSPSGCVGTPDSSLLTQACVFTPTIELKFYGNDQLMVTPPRNLEDSPMSSNLIIPGRLVDTGPSGSGRNLQLTLSQPISIITVLDAGYTHNVERTADDYWRYSDDDDDFPGTCENACTSPNFDYVRDFENIDECLHGGSEMRRMPEDYSSMITQFFVRVEPASSVERELPISFPESTVEEIGADGEIVAVYDSTGFYQCLDLFIKTFPNYDACRANCRILPFPGWYAPLGSYTTMEFRMSNTIDRRYIIRGTLIGETSIWSPASRDINYYTGFEIHSWARYIHALGSHHFYDIVILVEPLSH